MIVLLALIEAAYEQQTEEHANALEQTSAQTDHAE
jgi:hypothetical protein